MTRPAALTLGAALLFGLMSPLRAQDPMAGVDLNSPMMTAAEMSREDVTAMIAAGAAVDLSGKRLSGLDLSGLDLSGAVLRGAYLNKTSFKGTKLRRAAWAGW